MNRNSLVLQSLTCSYGKKTILSSIDIEFQNPQFCAIIGPNGCGKSTLLKNMSHINQPKKGDLIIDGQKMSSIKKRDLAQMITYLPQNPHVSFDLTVGELVGRGRFPYRKVLENRAAEDSFIIDKAIDQTGLNSLKDRKLGKLSGGQRQRAWIAMALAQETDFLFLDEPTTYLDIHHKEEILLLLNELVDTHQKTIVAVLHHINDARKHANRIIALKNGQIFYDTSGSTSDSLDLEKVEKLYDINCTIENGEIIPLQKTNLKKISSSKNKSISINNLSASYEKVKILKDINLHIKKGSITAIIGPNGSGKSTLLKTITGELKKDSGSIQLFNENADNLKQNQFAQKVSALVQNEYIPQEILNDDYCLLGRFRFTSYFKQWSKKDYLDSKKILSSLSVQSGQPMGELSGGQQQRCRIGRIINQDSDLMIFDEPSSYLDLQGQYDVLEMIKKINDESGKTIILILQDIWQVRLYSHFCIMIKDGSIFKEGKSRELLKESTLRELYGEVEQCSLTNCP